MTKLIYSLFISFFIFTAAQAQDQERIKRIDALKTAFITKKLDLSPDEAKGFWPIYNEFQKEMNTLWHQKRKNQFANKDNPGEALTTDLEYDTKILNVKKKYQKEFSKILPAQKVLALYRAEREFREELIKELKERRGN